MNIVKNKNIFFAISLLVIIPGVISLLLWGLKPAIDFTGGSQLTLQFSQTVSNQTENQIRTIFAQQKLPVVSFSSTGKQAVVQTTPIDQKENTMILSLIQQKQGRVTEQEFDTIGPIIGSETTLNAFYSVIAASILIVLFIAWSFREVPKPENSW